MWHYNTVVVMAGTSLLGSCAGLVGGYAVLRRRALTGDAVAHAALPGLCAAFLLAGHRSLPVMLLGALLSGLLGVAAISFLRRYTRIREDAAIGVVLSVFYAAGLALSRIAQQSSSVGGKAGLDSFLFGKTAGIVLSDVGWIAGVATACIAIVLCLYKEFLAISFDIDFARVQGWPTVALDMAMMALLAVTVVIGLPAVGVVMMAALVILPAAAARFWTDRLATMLMIAPVFGAAIGVIGTGIGDRFSLLPAGPVIVLTGSTLFFASLLLAPRRGVLSKWIRNRNAKLENPTMAGPQST